MDHFGIGAAMQGMAHVYFQSSRRTGRTISLIESMKDGDRIVFADSKEADRVRRLCLERGVQVECVVIAPKSPGRVFECGTPMGRTVFDHTWVELYYIEAIERAQREVDHLQQQASGYGEAHRETNCQAEELAKWRY